MNNKSTLTGIHIKLIAVCDELGLEHREEEPFGVFFVDVYLPEFHIALEADGPYHSLRKKKDAKRDKELWDIYGLPVIRYGHKKMKTNRQMEDIKWQIHQEIIRYHESAEERKMKAHQSLRLD